MVSFVLNDIVATTIGEVVVQNCYKMPRYAGQGVRGGKVRLWYDRDSSVSGLLFRTSELLPIDSSKAEEIKLAGVIR